MICTGDLLPATASLPTPMLAHEYGEEPIRATEDVDIVVDIRAKQGLIQRLCAWLESRGFDLAGISTENIGHRYPGKATFDILAPDNVGERANLATSPPANTLCPGTRGALDAAKPLDIQIGDRIADLREGLELLIEEVGPPDELTLTHLVVA